MSAERSSVIDVQQIPIDLRLPCDEVRIVAMQPFIQHDARHVEPFQWCEDAIGGQLDAIARTLQIARDGFNGRGANFTLFPEYAVPGLQGVGVIESTVDAATWPNGSVVIAGIHGVSRNEYSEIWESLQPQPTPGHLPDDVPKDHWVNCCAIWVKDIEGGVRRWLQPKIQPSWPERSVTYYDMFRGSTVYIFESEYESVGYPCRFFSLICFDWVATPAGGSVCEQVLQRLDESWHPDPKPLHWAFLLQHNDQPNHSTFLTRTYNFLVETTTHPFVERSDAIVVQVNTAVSRHPSGNGTGGFTACTFSPRAQFDTRACRPTVCMKPESLRGSKILSRCHDVVFREMGECIHAFTVAVPKFVTPDVTAKTFPLPMAHVHPIVQTDDPRLCGGSVPAETKWFGDSLDAVNRLSNTSLKGLPLSEQTATTEHELIARMRLASGPSVNTLVNWAACSFLGESEIRNESRCKNADLWDQCEKDALEHVVHSLTSIGLVYDVSTNSSQPHALIVGAERVIQVVAIRGERFEDCLKHYKYVRHFLSTSVLVILRDRDNLKAVPGEFDSILDPGNHRSEVIIDYHTVISYCREAGTSEALKGELDAILPKHDKPII